MDRIGQRGGTSKKGVWLVVPLGYFFWDYQHRPYGIQYYLLIAMKGCIYSESPRWMKCNLKKRLNNRYLI